MKIRNVLNFIGIATICLVLIMTLFQPKAWASSSAIATGNSTTDGRPVAWKNRDHWSTSDGWKVIPYHYQADGSSFGAGDRYLSSFNYSGVSAIGSSGIDEHTSIQIPWVGANDRGLGLVQVAGHTLTSSFAEDNGFPVSQDLENGMRAGYLNHIILSRAEHIDDVEQILRDTNDGGGFNGSFARNTSTIISVFDRWGNAATFEIDGDSFTRDNVTEEYAQDANGYFTALHDDDKDTTNPLDGEYSGFDWRTNFSKVNWTKSNGFPYFVDNQVTDVDGNGNITSEGTIPDGIHDWSYSSSAVKRYPRAGIRMDDPHLKDYRYFIQKDVGSYALGDKNSIETLSRNIGYLPREEKPTGWHLNRFVSTFGTVLVGSKIDDPYEGRLTTIWVALGEPAAGIFVPIFPYAGEVPEELMDMYSSINEKRRQVYDYTDDNACGYSCGRNSDHDIDTYALTGEYYGESGVMKYTFDIENWAFDQYDNFMTELRDGSRTLNELKSDMIQWQKAVAQQMKEYYESETSIFPAVEDAYVRSDNPDSNYNNFLSVQHDDRISYLKFNLKGVTGKPIQSIKLRLTESDNGLAGDTNFFVTKTTSSWNEQTVTWNTKPSTDGKTYGTYNAGQLNENEVIDIPLNPSFIEQGDGEYSIALVGSSGSMDDEFSMRETLKGAKIIVEFGDLNNIELDNRDATMYSEWSSSSTQPNYYGDNYLYRSTSGTGKEVVWTPYITNPGNYEIYYWLPDGTSNRTTMAPYTINYSGGSTTVFVDQTVSGGRWVQLGNTAYPFEAGIHGNVELSSSASDGKYVIADAVKFVKVN
ncbi:golvesin C-terminal-like domain-containing protein [Oceanobacillus damuensis]|uniref:golvesin C-terminal-like domain-containing protein n=1 Tax=Oceanobacillus damuensis TaxID=937928 RepID=UPI000829FBD6|nr:DNRLRE domain-containing protein [Oceanobacillus damuensis]